MKKLTHGEVLNTTSSGRVAATWPGAMALIADMSKTGSCANIVDRDGRFDIRIPPFVVEVLQLEKYLAPLLEKLREIMGPKPPVLRTHDIIFAPVGSPAQPWHVDDSSRKGVQGIHKYFTILVHLNPIEERCGGTEIWVADKINKGDLVRPRPGDAFVFNGTLLHRGQANLGSMHRWFYYASFSCHNDENV